MSVSGNNDLNVALRITGDVSGVSAASKQAQGDIGAIGVAGQQAGAAASAGLAKVEASLNGIATSAESAAAKTVASNDAMASSFTDVNARYESIIALQNTQATSLDELTARRAAYDAALRDGILLESEYERGVGALAKQEATLAAQQERSAAGVATLLSKYAGAEGALEKLTADEILLNDALKAGAISAEVHAAALTNMGSKRAVLEQEIAAANGVAGAFAKVRVETAGVTQEVSRLGSEALRGNFQRMESSGIVLAQRMGLLGLVFTGLGAAILGVAVAVGVVATAAVKGALETDQLNKAIIATGNYAGVTSGQVLSMGQRLGESSGKVRESREALELLIASGKVTGDQLSMIAKGAVDFATVTGISIEKSVQAFEKLSDEPVKASLKLNESYHFLTLSIYDQIAAAERNGDRQQAAAIAEAALADESSRRAAKLREDLGYLARSWNAVSEAAKGAWDKMLNLGREDSTEAKIKQVQEDLQKAEQWAADHFNGQSLLDRMLYGTSTAAQVDSENADLVNALKGRLDSLQSTSAKQAADAAAQAEEQRTQQQAVQASADLDQLVTHIDKAHAEQQKLNKLAADFYAIYQQGGQAALDAKTNQLGIGALSFSGPIADIPVGPGWEKLSNEVLKVKDAFKTARGEINSFSDGETRISDLIEKLSGDFSGPYRAALTAYDQQQIEITKNIGQANDLYAKGLISVEEYTAAIDNDRKAQELSAEAYKKKIEVLDALKTVQLDGGDAVDQLITKYREEQNALALSDEASKRLTSELTAEREMRKAIDQAIHEGHPERAQELQDLLQGARAHADYIDQLKQERGVLNDWAQTASQDISSGLQMINKDLIEGGNLAKDFGNIFKNVFEQILLEIEKLAIEAPLMNMLFGTNMPTLSTAQGAIGLLMQNGSPLGSILNLFSGSGSSGAGASAFAGSQAQATVGNITATGAGGGGILGNLGSLGNLGNLFSGAGTLGGNLWSRFTGGYGYDGGVMTGPSYELSNDFMGPPSALAGPGVPGYGGYGSALGQGIGILGGAYAGYNEFKNAGGGVAGAAGGAAYGVGTYFAGAGVSAALAGGVSAGLAAIPVVGWIALAAMLIDKFSGGKLFGTAYQTKSAEVDLSVGAAGGEASTLLHQEGQKALFGGTKRRTKSIASSQDAIDAANALYDQIKQIGEQAAQAIDVAVPPIIDASINTITEYDKKGHVKSTKILVEAFGKQWEEATQELAQKRLAADEIIATVAASSIGKNAQQIADQWQGSAEKLADGAALLLGATADINSGKGLLGANATLEETVKVTQKLEGAGESLVQTYSRLVTETDAVKEAFDLAGTTMRQTGADAVQYADDATKKLKGKSLAEFFADYYSPSEMAARQADVLKPQVAKDLAAIGLGPDTTMAEFKAAYTAAMKSGLSAEDLAKWIDAGIDLADFTKAMQAAGQSSETSAQQIEQGTKQYDAFMAPFRRAVDGLDDFTHVINDMAAPLQNTIEQAETLAKAAGMQGASAQDISAIIQVATQQGVAAFQQLEKNAQQLASNLYGTSFIDGLKKQLADSEAFGISRPDLQKKIDQAQGNVEAQQQGQRLIDAQQLAREVAEIAAFNGGSIDDILKKLGIPLDAFSGDLKLQGQSVEAYIGKLEDQAKMQLHIADDTAKMPPLLADILAAIRGEPLPYQDASRFLPSDTPQQAAALGKPSRGTVGAPGVSVGPAAPAPTGGSDSPNTGGDTAPIVPNRDGNRVGVVPRQLISGPTTSTAAPSADATLGDGIRKLIDVNHDGLGDVKDLLTAVVAALNTIAAKTGSQTPTVAGHRILPQPVPTR